MKPVEQLEESGGMLLERSFRLPSELRVRLRLARPRDQAGIAAVLSAAGVGELEAARLVRFDPRRRVVICATTLDGWHERLVAVGAIDLRGEAPDLLVVGPGGDDALRELLDGALRQRAQIYVANHAA